MLIFTTPIGSVIIDFGLNFSQSLKPTLNLKNVKPKVDSHWKKSEVPAASFKRRNSQGSPPKLVTTKTVRFAKAEVPQLVTIKAADGKNIQFIQSNEFYSILAFYFQFKPRKML